MEGRVARRMLRHHLTPAGCFHGDNNLVWLSCRNSTFKGAAGSPALFGRKCHQRDTWRRSGSGGISDGARVSVWERHTRAHSDGAVPQNKPLKMHQTVSSRRLEKRLSSCAACSLMSCSQLGSTPVMIDSNGDPELLLETWQSV